jgi:hypothetical protein
MNKFRKGQKVFYYLMDSPCQSIIIDFYKNNGSWYYKDHLFDNIKEEYLFNNKKDCINFHNKKWTIQ